MHCGNLTISEISSSVKPKNSSYGTGLSMLYSLKLFDADWELYFFIGRIPVRYAREKVSVLAIRVIYVNDNLDYYEPVNEFDKRSYI